MSLNVVPLAVKKSLDPRLNIREGGRVYVVQTGAQVNSYQQFFSATPSNSSISISTNPPSTGIAISRKIMKRAQFDITVRGNNTTGGPLLVSQCHAPRFMPLNAITTSEAITINNATISESQQNQMYGYLMRYHSNFNDKLEDPYPSYMDTTQTYREAIESSKNPLADYLNSTSNDARGSYVGYQVLDNQDGATTATIRLTTLEPVLMSPFIHHTDDAEALIGVSNMSYNCTFGNLQRVLSLEKYQGTNPNGSEIEITSIETNVSQFSLLFQYMTPDPLTSPLPSQSIYTLYNMTSYSTRFNTIVQPGDSYNMVLNSIQISSIPKRMYIFAKRNQADETAFTTDTSMAINCFSNQNPIQLTFNNHQFLASSLGIDLFQMSKQNGLDSSLAEFANHTGSVIALEFGRDIGLPPDLVSGSAGAFQVGLTVQMTNTSTEAYAPVLFVIVISEGAMTIVGQSVTTQFGIISQQDAVSAPVDLTIPHVRKNIYGGSWAGFKKFLSGVKDSGLISKGLSMIPSPYAQAGAQVARALGAGVVGGRMGRRGGAVVGAGFSEKKTVKKTVLSDFN